MSNLDNFNNIYANLAESAYNGKRPNNFPYDQLTSSQKKDLESGQSVKFDFSQNATVKIGKDKDGKASNYAFVQNLAGKFEMQNGSLICAELLGLKKPENSSIPEDRTEQYYSKRPCVKIVEETARIWAEAINEGKKQP